MNERGGPNDCIRVDDDEFPHVFTSVLTHDVWGGQPRLYTADGERAGMNLVDSLETDSRVEIQSVKVVDATVLRALTMVTQEVGQVYH